MNKKYLIYKITNIINGKFYIGQHYGYANDKYMGSGLLIHKAYKKYGIENFIKETIEYVNNANEMNIREKYWIEKLNSFTPNGYNINAGGTGGDNITNNPNKDEIKKNISEGCKRRHKNNPEISKEQGKKVSGENNGRYIDGRSKSNKLKSILKIKEKELDDEKLAKEINFYYNEKRLKVKEIYKICNIGHSRFDRIMTEYKIIKRKRITPDRDYKEAGKKVSGENNGRYIDGRCINDMPIEKEKEFKKLFYERKSYKEIINILNISYNMIKQYVIKNDLKRLRPPTGSSFLKC